jgi:hypothetical protein
MQPNFNFDRKKFVRSFENPSIEVFIKTYQNIQISVGIDTGWLKLKDLVGKG